jgi:hypothetical protein
MNHGWGFWNYGVDAGHFRSEDIVVSPEGCTPGQGTSFNFVQGKKDGDQIQQLIQLFRKAFPIGNVYLYGHSQGAFFTYWFAGEYPESINGIVAHAGNALNPQFPKLAQERVAIAILHGEVDQVVSVDAAYRSEKLYREAGYKNLKLRVVPNLRPEAGHWPLPDEVKTLLEWCDQVCVSSADGALLVAEAELAKQAPSASVICDAIERADQLLKQERGATKSALEERLTRCRNFSALLLDRAVAFLSESQGQQDAKADYGDWCLILRNTLQIPGSEAAIKKVASKLLSRSEKDTRSATDALKKMDRSGARALKDGIKTYLAAPVASNQESLGHTLKLHKPSADSGTPPKEWEEFERALAERNRVDVVAKTAWAELLSKCLADWKADSPEPPRKHPVDEARR